MRTVRPPSVAGVFYPGQPDALRSALAALLADVAPAAATRPLKLLIVPHAGYVYSGPVAASAYALLNAQRARIRRVVLIGPTHRVAVPGVAIPGVAAFATPLGAVELDHGCLSALAEQPHVVTSDAAHAAEHALEVQIPFLQSVLGAFTLVPLAVGRIEQAPLVDLLLQAWGGPETVVIVSSDLSHYRGYRDAQEIDRATIAHILAGADGLDHEQACGATAINAALAIARRTGLRARLLAMNNSGDTAGDRVRVVGYCSIAFEGAGDARH